MDDFDVQTNPQSRLLIISGLPRSGTTWLGKIFDSHPDTLYRHEPDTFPRLDAMPRCPPVADAEKYQAFIQDFIAELPRMDSARVAAKMPLFAKSWQPGWRHNLFRCAALAAKFASRAHLEIPVLGARAHRVHPAPVPVWKSIESLGRFGLLMHALPEARGIHLIRHPCGQISSLLRGLNQQAFQDNTSPSEYYRLFQALVETPQARRRGLSLQELWDLTPEERLAWHWVLTNEKAAEDTANLNRARLVRYEDVCEDPVKTTHRLFQFSGLAWNEQTAAFLHASTNAENGAYYSVFKTPAHSAGRWRHELDAVTIERILGVVSQSALADLYLPVEKSRPAAMINPIIK